MMANRRRSFVCTAAGVLVVGAQILVACGPSSERTRVADEALVRNDALRDGGLITADAGAATDSAALSDANDAASDGSIDYASYFVEGPLEISLEDATPYPGYPGYPQFPQDPPVFGSIPALLGTTQTCVESLTLPVIAGAFNLMAPGINPLVPAVSCDALDDIVCRWTAACAYHYRDVAGCSGSCILSDTAKIVRQKRTLTNTAPAWLSATVCAAALASGVAQATCIAKYPAINCNGGVPWPVPIPTTVCK